MYTWRDDKCSCRRSRNWHGCGWNRQHVEQRGRMWGRGRRRRGGKKERDHKKYTQMRGAWTPHSRSSVIDALLLVCSMFDTAPGAVDSLTTLPGAATFIFLFWLGGTRTIMHQMGK